MQLFLAVYLITYILVGIVALYLAFRYRRQMLSNGFFYILIYPLLNFISVATIGNISFYAFFGLNFNQNSIEFYHLKAIDEFASENFYYSALLICVQYMGVISKKVRYSMSLLILIAYTIELYFTDYVTINEEFINLTYTPLIVKSFVILSSLLFLKRQISSNNILYLKDNPYVWLTFGLLISMTFNLVLLVSKFNNYATEENQIAMLIIALGELIALLFYVAAAKKNLNWNNLEILLK